jgi:hypothetical protein
MKIEAATRLALHEILAPVTAAEGAWKKTYEQDKSWVRPDKREMKKIDDKFTELYKKHGGGRDGWNKALYDTADWLESKNSGLKPMHALYKVYYTVSDA